MIATQLTAAKPDIGRIADVLLSASKQWGKISGTFNGNKVVLICGEKDENRTDFNLKKFVFRSLCARLGQLIKDSGKVDANLYGDEGIVIVTWIAELSNKKIRIFFKNTSKEQFFSICCEP